MTTGTGLSERAESARTVLEGSGVDTVSESRLVNGLQVTLRRDGRTCRLNYYWSARKGFSFVPAGGDSHLLEAVRAILQGEAEPRLPSGLRIGTDEAGKGDWFGPLVAAGVCCDDGTAEELTSQGVADSKTLGKARLRRLASLLMEREGLVWSVRTVSPGEYNRLFRQFRARGMNSLDIQAMAHGDVVKELAARTGAGLVVIDRFCSRERLAPWLPDGDYSLSLRSRAEDDPVVAAASIIAREVYLRELEALSRGLGSALIPGSGNEADAVGREVARNHGRDKLASLAKVHFSNYFRVLSP